MQQIYREQPMLKCDLIKLQSNFIEIAHWHGCSPVNLLHISKHLFLRTPLYGCFWMVVLVSSNNNLNTGDNCNRKSRSYTIVTGKTCKNYVINYATLINLVFDPANSIVQTKWNLIALPVIMQ